MAIELRHFARMSAEHARAAQEAISYGRSSGSMLR
jgi:hypothetical protein